MIRHRREPCQDIFDVSVRIDSATAAARDDRIDHGTSPPRVLRSDEEPVLLPDRCGNAAGTDQ